MRTKSLPLLVILLLPLLVVQNSHADPETLQGPDIIYIYTDQQSATMMSSAGNAYLDTPAMDYMAENGVRFTRAYTTNPVCSPARVSLMTGRFPGYFSDQDGNQVRENHGAMDIPQVSGEVQNTTLASYMKKAGYELLYGGKEHLPPSLTPQALGFKDISDDERKILAEEAARFIRADHDKPYFMVLSLINPHDICYMAIRDHVPPTSPFMNAHTELAKLDSALEWPKGVGEEEFWSVHAPPLPMAQDAKLIQVLRRREGQTLVLFSSDHGDMDAAHRMEHKTALYEEAVNIPLIAMWKGQIPAGKVDDTHLVSNGLDLLPTVSDYAGIDGLSDPRGRSLRPLLEGKRTDWRKTLGVESEIGRMVVSEDGLKYIRYDATGMEERLHDLNSDPYETRHFTDDADYSDRLAELREAFEAEWFPGSANQ